MTVRKHYCIATLKKYSGEYFRWLYMPIEAQTKEEIESIIADLGKRQWKLDDKGIIEIKEFNIDIETERVD